ncbi:MAG: sugar phosphate isomerase/epimerase family protein [Chitinophagaceae bacterium]
MTQSRRQFIQNAGLLGAGAALSSFSLKYLTEGFANAAYGIQLYTLRDDLPKDPKNVIATLSRFGYKQIESFEGKQGFFWGMTNKEFKKFMDMLGMKMVSTHCDHNKEFERKAGEAGEIGMKYLICPYIGPQKTLDDYKRHADSFNKAGEICKKNGLRFAYHNHGYTFESQEGQFPQDILMKNTDPELVDFEMDIYWVVTAGANPEEWLNKYPNRFRLCHVKDRAKNAPLTEHEASVDLGTGSIDFSKILKTGKEKGLKYTL